jgi:DNA sulfur modification protein DndC
LRYALTIDVLEKEAAAERGIRPRFQLVSVEQLFAIDAMWSLQAFHRPFHALKIYDEVYNQGVNYPVPAVETASRPKEMPERYLWVGRDWEDGDAYRYTGLRSVIHELASQDSGGCMATRTLTDGIEVLAINTESLLTVEVETAYFLLMDDLKELLRKHDDPRYSPTEAYFHYVSLGAISVKSGQEREIDAMLRRANWKVRQGVSGQIDHRTLLDRSVTAAEAGKAKSTDGVVRRRGAEGSRSESFAQLDAGISIKAAMPVIWLKPESARTQQTAQAALF